jgi:hypothetical protein
VKRVESPDGKEVFILCRSRDRAEKERAIHDPAFSIAAKVIIKPRIVVPESSKDHKVRKSLPFLYIQVICERGKNWKRGL